MRVFCLSSLCSSSQELKFILDVIFLVHFVHAGGGSLRVLLLAVTKWVKSKGSVHDQRNPGMAFGSIPYKKLTGGALMVLDHGAHGGRVVRQGSHGMVLREAR